MGVVGVVRGCRVEVEYSVAWRDGSKKEEGNLVGMAVYRWMVVVRRGVAWRGFRNLMYVSILSGVFASDRSHHSFFLIIRT